jgi:signal transduction histidine kinase
MGLGEKAHELRRPLGVALGYLEVLLEGRLGSMSDAQRKALVHIQAKLSEAHQDLEALVLLGRLEANALRPTLQGLDVAREVESAMGRAQARVELAEGSVTLDQPETAVSALADRALLARILDNLLDNAIAYTDGAPRVALQVAADEVAKRPVVRVSDEGVGMNPELREQIFVRGFRAASSGAPSGSGLGLYVSRQAAEQMGAELVVERTQPGQGSCFRLELSRADGGGEVAPRASTFASGDRSG